MKFYMFRSGAQTKKRTNKHRDTHEMIEMNKVKLNTSRVEFLHCNTVIYPGRAMYN